MNIDDIKNKYKVPFRKKREMPFLMFYVILFSVAVLIGILFRYNWDSQYCEEMKVVKILTCAGSGDEKRCALLLKDNKGGMSTDFNHPAKVGDVVEVCRNYNWRKR